MNSYRTDFENMRIPTLENIHNGITHKKEVLQEKMSQDMGRKPFYDILPRNYDILPMEKCSIRDIKELDDLHAKQFDCFWTLENKRASEQNDLDTFNASFRFYSFIDELNDIEVNKFYESCKYWNNNSIMTSYEIIEELKKNPDFIEEVTNL